MSRVLSLVVALCLTVFFSLPVVAVLLWAAVFLLGYTPSFWLALVVLVGVGLNLAVLVGRSVHLSARPR